MLKEMKEGRKYFLINIDEPYAEEIYEVLKKGQMTKGEWPKGDISFKEWCVRSWPFRNKHIGVKRIPILTEHGRCPKCDVTFSFFHYNTCPTCENVSVQECIEKHLRYLNYMKWEKGG